MADSRAQQRKTAADMQSQRLQDLNSSRMPTMPPANDNAGEKDLNSVQNAINTGTEDYDKEDSVQNAINTGTEDYDKENAAADIQQQQAQARKQARSDETRMGINQALAPANAVKGLLNMGQTRKLNKEIKKNRDIIDKNLKEIKKLKTKIRRRIYIIIGEIVGGISAPKALWDFVKALEGKEKMQIQQMQKNNEAADKQNKNKERQIYNLQNIVQLQAANQNQPPQSEQQAA